MILAPGAVPPGRGYRYYVLTVMTLVYLTAFLDRQALAIVLPQIKADFALSDLALGVLVGPAFAIVYSVLGIPLAMLGDRANRRNIVAGSVAIFSAATLVSGFVANFWQLVVARLGVGIGQAGTSPSINSMLADLFPPQQRSAVFAVYTMGANLGMLLSFVIGLVAARAGWQSAFVVAGLPGLVLALLLLLTVREPARGALDGKSDIGASEGAPGFAATCRFLWRSPTFRNVNLAMIIASAGGYAIVTFLPTFLVRSHGMSVADASIAFALLFGGVSALGTLLGGTAADRAARRGMSYALLVPVAIMLVSAPFVPLLLLSPGLMPTLTAAVVPALFIAAHVGPSYAAVQGVAPLRMRAVATAVLLFNTNIFGLGVGPLVVGALSDALTPRFGPDAIRYALLVNFVTLLMGAWLFWRASRTYERDIALASVA